MKMLDGMVNSGSVRRPPRGAMEAMIRDKPIPTAASGGGG